MAPLIMPELSVVIPVYGCDSCLRQLHLRLQQALSATPVDWEVVFVDDRSPDDSWETLKGLAQEDRRVRVFRLSRNFGQHAAITAGLAESTGRWVAVMDCDLQDPPEEVPRLYAKALEGYDVVLSRRQRRQDTLLRRLAGSGYYRLRNVLTKTDMYTNYTNLSVISRKVVDSFLSLRDKDRQYLLIVDWLGFRRTAIDVEQEQRHSGRSSYSWRSLLKVAVDGMFFQSTALLRWIIYAGFLLAAAGVALAAYTMIVFALGRNLPAWTGLPVLLLVLTGFIIISTGVTGLYVGKVFDQVKGRPLYVIDSKVVDGIERSFVGDLRDGTASAADERAVQAAEPETDALRSS
jgi:glycosyltransferase involved in cell wall biosynthesis